MRKTLSLRMLVPLAIKSPHFRIFLLCLRDVSSDDPDYINEEMVKYCNLPVYALED